MAHAHAACPFRAAASLMIPKCHVELNGHPARLIGGCEGEAYDCFVECQSPGAAGQEVVKQHMNLRDYVNKCMGDPQFMENLYSVSDEEAENYCFDQIMVTSSILPFSPESIEVKNISLKDACAMAMVGSVRSLGSDDCAILIGQRLFVFYSSVLPSGTSRPCLSTNPSHRFDCNDGDLRGSWFQAVVKMVDPSEGTLLVKFLCDPTKQDVLIRILANNLHWLPHGSQFSHGLEPPTTVETLGRIQPFPYRHRMSRGAAKIMDLPQYLLSSLLETCGMSEPIGSYERMVQATYQRLEDKYDETEVKRRQNMANLNEASGSAATDNAADELKDKFTQAQEKLDEKVQGWSDHPHTRPRVLVHAGMVCKVWRDMSRVGRDPGFTALALFEAIKGGMPAAADDIRAVRVAMRTCIITRGKEDVFEALFAIWIEKQGAAVVRDELKAPYDWEGNVIEFENDIVPTLLDLASTHGQAKIAFILIEAGAGEGLKAGKYDFGIGNGMGPMLEVPNAQVRRSSPIIHAYGRTMRERDIRVLQLLIENGASVLVPEEDHYSFLHLAVLFNYFQAVEMLLKAGAPVNHYNINNPDPSARLGSLTPLDLAVTLRARLQSRPEMREENERICELLYNSGGFLTNPRNLLASVSTKRREIEGMRERLKSAEDRVQVMRVAEAHRQTVTERITELREQITELGDKMANATEHAAQHRIREQQITELTVEAISSAREWKTQYEAAQAREEELNLRIAELKQQLLTAGRD